MTFFNNLFGCFSSTHSPEFHPHSEGLLKKPLLLIGAPDFEIDRSAPRWLQPEDDFAPSLFAGDRFDGGEMCAVEPIGNP